MTKTKPELTQARVRELFDYNFETGDLIWKRVTNTSIRVGSIACSTRSQDKYLRVGVDGKNYLIHRVIWLWVTGDWPKEIDHINHNQRGNRWGNLRDVSHQTNCRNQILRINNKSGHPGVCWNKQVKKWQVGISNLDGNSIHLGLIKDLDEAIKIRKAAELLYSYSPGHGQMLEGCQYEA